MATKTENKQPELYSYHVFMFPFKWRYTENLKKMTLEEQTELAGFSDKVLEDGRWKRKPISKLNTLALYNEYNYFYDFVREVLYDTDKEVADNDKIDFIRHFEYKTSESNPNAYNEYRIKTCRSGKEVEYILEIDSILLHLYNTGVGVLSFHLNNRLKNQSGQEDVLLINQYGRRLYPPFFDLNKHEIGVQTAFDDIDFKSGLHGNFQDKTGLCGIDNKRGVQWKELPNSIRLSKSGTEDPTVTENFSEYHKVRGISEGPFRLPAYISGILPNILTTSDKSDTKLIYISPVLDDRMFTLCWYGNDKKSGELRKSSDSGPAHLKSDWWYRFLFVDGGLKTCQNDQMSQRLLEEHTNARWVGFGTLYGVSRYSFVCLTSSLETLREDGINAAFLVSHMQTMYYKIAELCLLQRATILRFSDEVTRISSLKPEEGLPRRVSSLYKQYIRFVNKIYFREVTAQEQGIELYDLLQTHMKLKRDTEDLDGEIQELFQYVQLDEDRRRNAQNDNLNRWVALITAFLFVPTLVFGYFGTNFFEFEFLSKSAQNLKWGIYIGGGVILLSLLIYISIILASGRRKFKLRPVVNWLLPTLMAFLLAGVMATPYWLETRSKTSEIESEIKMEGTLTIPLPDSTEITIPLDQIQIHQKGNIHDD